jgi:hypothetical protein
MNADFGESRVRKPSRRIQLSFQRSKNGAAEGEEQDESQMMTLSLSSGTQERAQNDTFLGQFVGGAGTLRSFFRSRSLVRPWSSDSELVDEQRDES